MKKPESLAGKIRSRLMWMGLLGTLLTVLLSALLFYQVVYRNADEDLRRICSAVAAGYMAQESPRPESLGALIPSGERLRFTLIQPDGSVSYDSAAAPGLENHLTRPEVQQALQSGVGRATRPSATSGYETHYYAMRLTDGSVLRAADEEMNIWGAYQELALPFLECCALMVALSLLFSTRLTRTLVAPVNRMAEHLDQVADYVPYEELLPFAATIQSDQQLRENNEAMRREFTANVSHELKTPLTSISGYAELIETGMAKPEDVPAMAGRIHREAQRMICLAGDIIQLTELDGMRGANTAQAELAPLDLAPLLKEVAAAMTVNARKAYVTLQCSAAPAVVLGSRDQLAELITNLCDNAIRYNRPGGHVQLSCGIGADGSPTLTVEDNGIGIPEAAQSRVFERFYRVDKSRSKATGGTGLGLAIVKHIAILHGARIELKSQVGTGTTIRVVFPKE